MSEPHRLTLRSGDTRLSVLKLQGPAQTDGPAVVLLHGMRDVATSLLPVAEVLARRYPVLLPELRGHGASDQPGAYSLEYFLFDLHQVVTQLTEPPAVIIGHSLGGQVTARFAALYPELVRAAVLIEGLGPPARPEEADDDVELRRYGQRLAATLGTGAAQRPLPDLEFAAARLSAKNPRLGADRALNLARQATRYDADGNLFWAFDPRIQAAVLSLRRRESERYWQRVRCPTLVIAGLLSHEYWREAIATQDGWDGRFQAGEMAARAALFPDHEYQAFDGSGHMVHYDEPQRLTATILDFLERKL